jgi:ElaB/YqjD/DUF883 family membrane-anchored ribosome-binding protein
MTSDPQSENHQGQVGQDEAAPSKEIPTSQPHSTIDSKPFNNENAEPYKKKSYLARYKEWRDNPWRVKAGWTDKAIVFLTLGIVFLGFMQWLEMHGSGKQTDKIITASNLIEDHQKQLVADNRQVLEDNRLALDKSLGENRVELGKVLKQNREALQAQTGASNGQLEAVQQQTEISERPWIKITDAQTVGNGDIVPALSFQTSHFGGQNYTQATFQIQVSYRNIGHSVASTVVHFALFLPLWKNGYADVIAEEKKRFCEQTAKAPIDPAARIVLFPDDSHDWSAGPNHSITAENTNYFADMSGNQAPYILPVVAVCGGCPTHS